MGLTLIWVADLNSERKNYPMKEFWAIFLISDLNSERKNYPMKEFRAIFPITSILVIRSTYAKKGQFSILAVFQNVWDLHKFELQI